LFAVARWIEQAHICLGQWRLYGRKKELLCEMHHVAGPVIFVDLQVMLRDFADMPVCEADRVARKTA